MNWALRPQALGPPTGWYWPLALTLPIVLAGGIIEKSTMSSSLPKEDSYRSSQSDMAIESSSWRSEGQDYERWREPPPYQAKQVAINTQPTKQHPKDRKEY